MSEQNLDDLKKTTDVESTGEEMSEAELQTLSGGKPNNNSDSCKETSDTGMMGCPG